jgi:hypothetical protein
VVGHDQFDLLAVDGPPMSAMAILMASAPPWPSMSEYTPEISVMKPILITSPEICAEAGAVANAAAAAVTASAIALSFIFISSVMKPA